MAPRSDNTSSITISDFSPGIFSSYHAGSGAYASSAPSLSLPANGAATIENTHSCCADPNSKWLIPLPRKTSGAETTLPGSSGSYPNAYEMKTLDALAFGPMAPSSGANNPYDVAEQVFVVYGFFYTVAGATRTYTLGRYWDPSGSKKEWLYNKSVSAPPTYVNARLNAQLGLGRTAASGTAVPVPAGTSIQPSLMWLVENGGGTASGAVAAGDQLSGLTFGTDTGAWTWTDFTGASNSTAGVYPSYTNTLNINTDTFKLRAFSDQAVLSVPHQGRFVSLCGSQYAFGPSIAYNEKLGFSAVNQFYTTAANDGYGTIDFIGEGSPLAGVMASMNASDLIIIRKSGGAVLIRGSLTDPTIIRLPGVESTGGVITKPINVPGLGLAYCTVNGVFVFDGQATSKKISPQIDGQFWQYYDPATDNRVGNAGRLAYWNSWLCVPNDYMFDTRTGGWWKLTNTATHNAYSTYDVGAQTNRLYAIPNKVTSTYLTAFDYYDANTLALSYSWQSQPLIETTDKVLSFTSIDLTAMAAPNSTNPTVTLTFTGYNSDGSTMQPVPEVFSLSTSTGPQFNERNMHPAFQGRYVQVRVEASADSGAAPTVGPITLGVREERIVPRS